jgi:Uma2 family endonuclease
MALPVTPIQLELRTYEDLLAMPDDGNRYELIFGEIVMSPAPKTKHQRVQMLLSRKLSDHAFTHRLGELFSAPLDVKFSMYSVVQPDLVFVSRARANIVTEDCIDGAPDLIVEILSPSTRSRDLVKKAALYADHGVPEYWIVDPDSETVVVNVWQDGLYHALQPAGGLVRSNVFSDLQVTMGEIFAVPEWLNPTKQETE